MKPLDAVLAVTWRCNARCAMCGIWKSPPSAELSPEHYRKLPASLRDVNLTGGEPFLREDLPAVHAAVRAACPRSRTVISTNGLLTNPIVARVREMARLEPQIGIAISIDGPAEVHDRLRGVPGTYKTAMETLQALKEEGFHNLRLAFTITKTNVGHFEEIYRLAQELGVQFTCAIEHTSEHYFHTGPRERRQDLPVLRSQLEAVMRQELGSFSPKRWARAYFMKGLWDFATGRGRPLPCRAGRDFFFVDPAGDVFTCNAAPFKMGNLREQSFDAIWDSGGAYQARVKADHCPNGCWMICTARMPIRRAAARVMAWAMWKKVGGGELLGER